MQVIATAGHVDHGKSSLIAALTGIDPDRLAEEKRRGLTIDLGYAWCELPGGEEVGFVDVPGHERFVHTMLAGIGPVGLVLFVVSADEGWSRQSEEHLAIVDLLQIKGAVVALTKTDLADPELTAFTRHDIAEHIAGTVLEGAPIIAVSSRTGDGMGDLGLALAQMVTAAALDSGAIAERPRLSVDRVFTIAGSGTVVTGTLTGGSLHVGDEVTLLPSGNTSRIRSLQTHKRDVQSAHPVSRVAVNLTGTDRHDVTRGDTLVTAESWHLTRTLDVSLTSARGQELPTRGAFTFHLGSAERVAKVRLIGGGRFARIKLEQPFVAVPGDRFVLRESGRRATIAGGVVLDIDPPTRVGEDVTQRLAARAGASAMELASLVVQERRAVRRDALPALTGQAVAPAHMATDVGAWLVSPVTVAEITDVLVRTVELHHADHPTAAGAPLPFVREAVMDALRRAHAPAETDLASALIDHAVGTRAIEQDADVLRETARTITVDPRLETLIEAITAAEPSPPTVQDLARDGTSGDLVDLAIRSGRLVRVSPELVFTAEFIDRTIATLGSLVGIGITVSAFREHVGTSRKYAVPLLEYFDKRGITRREGDVRILRADLRPSG